MKHKKLWSAQPLTRCLSCMEAQVVVMLSLCPPAITKVQSQSLLFRKAFQLLFDREELAKKEVCGRVHKGLPPRCVVLLGSLLARLLVELGISTRSQPLPPKHWTKDDLAVGDALVLWRGFHLLCTLPPLR